MNWMPRTLAAKADMVTRTEGPNIWKEALERWQTSPPGVFVADQKTELDNAGYTILEKTADPLNATYSMHQAASMPGNHLGVKGQKLYSFLPETFQSEKQLKEKRSGLFGTQY